MSAAPSRPTWLIATLLVAGLALFGGGLGMLAAHRPAPPPARDAAADWAAYDGAVMLVAACADGARVFAREDGRRFIWRGGWTEAPTGTTACPSA